MFLKMVYVVIIATEISGSANLVSEIVSGN